MILTGYWKDYICYVPYRRLAMSIRDWHRLTMLNKDQCFRFNMHRAHNIHGAPPSNHSWSDSLGRSFCDLLYFWFSNGTVTLYMGIDFRIQLFQILFSTHHSHSTFQSKRSPDFHTRHWISSFVPLQISKEAMREGEHRGSSKPTRSQFHRQDLQFPRRSHINEEDDLRIGSRIAPVSKNDFWEARSNYNNIRLARHSSGIMCIS